MKPLTDKQAGHELANQIAYIHYPLGKGSKHQRYMLRKLASTLIGNWLEEKAQEIIKYPEYGDEIGIREILSLSDYVSPSSQGAIKNKNYRRLEARRGRAGYDSERL